MDITPLIHDSRNIIKGYQKGSLLIKNQEYYGSIVVFPEKVITLDKLSVDSLKSFLSKEVEVLLIGTGKVRNVSDLSVKAYLNQQKDLNFEFMSTDAACRTYNILALEDRFVIACLCLKC